MEQQPRLRLDQGLAPFRVHREPSERELQEDQQREGERALEQRAASVLRSTVASVEPSDTVTTKSKAFIFESVRLPETRNSSSTSAA